MSKKTLLNEATVRRFMKLANTQPLADSFVNEYGMAAKAHEDEEEAPEDMGPMDEPMDEPMDAMDADDEPAADEPVDALDDEPEADMDMADDAEEVEISEDDRDVLAQAAKILDKIAGGAGDAGMDMGDEAGMRDAMVQEDETLEEEAVEEGMHAKKDDDDAVEEAMHAKKDEEEKMEEVNIMDEDQLVQEVTRRVADKLRAAIKSRE